MSKGSVTIEARGVYYKELNNRIHEAVSAGAGEISLTGVNGQRYIGNAIKSPELTITVNGVPGNDLAAFMDGPTIRVLGNGQDGVANTMNDGRVYIHGHAGDVLGYGMRGGRLFVKGDVGYRVGIHMKEYHDRLPIIVAGGRARDFFGEYMAGGILVLLGLDGQSNGQDPADVASGGTPDSAANGHPMVGYFCGTGMHGGVIYIRGDVENFKLGKEVGVVELTDEDRATLLELVEEYCREFGGDPQNIIAAPFTKLAPVSKRPYGNLYAY